MYTFRIWAILINNVLQQDHCHVEWIKNEIHTLNVAVMYASNW